MLTLDLTQTFTNEEKEVYELLCQNLTNNQIAQELEMSEGGVKYYLGRIYKKLGVQSDGKSDLTSARARAIAYGGTKIVEEYKIKAEIYQSKAEILSDKNLYTREEIYQACETISWHSKERMAEILDDVFKVLESKRRKDPFSALHKMDKCKAG